MIGYLHLKFSGTLSKISCSFSVHSWPRFIGDSCVKTDWNCLFKIVVFSLFSVTRIFLDLSMSGEIPCESCLQIWSFMLLYGKKVKQCIFYAPPPESGGVLCYTLRNFECPSVRPSVCLSVRPSVSAHHHSCIGNSSYSFRPILLNFTGVLRMV